MEVGSSAQFYSCIGPRSESLRVAEGLFRGNKRREVLEDLPAFCYSPPSFLTPPFGFALFYLRAVAPPEVTTAQIYRGVVPFIIIQLIGLLLLILFPEIVTWAL